jgi:hypothetical protein
LAAQPWLVGTAAGFYQENRRFSSRLTSHSFGIAGMRQRTDLFGRLSAAQRRKIMKTRMAALVTVMAFAIALPVQLAAQHTRFKLIDLGTLGGTNSYQTAPGRTVNNRGEVIAFADTDVPDPNAPNCLQPDCLISYAVKGHTGERTNLGALPGVNDSIPTWITANGLIAGISENGEIDPLTGLPEVRAVFWDKNGAIKNLGTLGGNSARRSASTAAPK